jgi:uncharacterized protein YdeI (YjbR/CyaY-like superfamily)
MQHTLPEVDVYIEDAADFARPILRKLRELFHQACPEIEESIKWSSPFFEHKGIVGYMTAFKQHVSYGFWKADLMTDPAGILRRAGKARAARLKAASVEDLPADSVLIQYIEEAVDLNQRGVKVSRTQPDSKREKLTIPDDLAAALAENAKARTCFADLSYGRRKDYVEWITEAKREATRRKRLATALEWLAEGKPRNWKYMKEYR